MHQEDNKVTTQNQECPTTLISCDTLKIAAIISLGLMV